MTTSAPSGSSARTACGAASLSKGVNKLREWITPVRITDQGCMMRGYARSVVLALNETREVNTFIPALASLYAMNPIEVPIAHEERHAGRSKYSLYSLIRLNFDLITGFSVVPLQLFSMVGMAVSVLSALLVVYLFVRRLIVGPEAEGLFSLFGLVFFFIGLALFGIGLLGEYVGRIYAQVRERPRYIVAGRSRGGRREEHAADLSRATAQAVRARHCCDAGGGVRLQRGRGSLCPRVVGRRTSRSRSSSRMRMIRARANGSAASGARARRTACGSRPRMTRTRSSGSPRGGARARIFVFSFYYRHLLNAAWLALPQRGALNMHGSLLPKYRGPRAGALGDHSRRDGHRREPALHAGEAGCRRPRRSAGGGHPGERHGARGVDESGRRRRSRCSKRSLPKLIAGTAAARALDLKQGIVFRPPPSRGWPHRLAPGRTRGARSGARRGAAVSRRLYRGERV